MTSIIDKSQPTVLVHRHAMPPDLCDSLVNVTYEIPVVKGDRNAFWNNRYWWYQDIAKHRPALGEMMRHNLRKTTANITNFYHLNKNLYPDLLQIMKWESGMSMPLHADNANPDGSHHEMAYREYSSILYLNDDYVGGALRFGKIKTIIQPEKGMLIAFPSDMLHQHEVCRVEAGTRWTMPAFFTSDFNKADRALL